MGLDLFPAKDHPTGVSPHKKVLRLRSLRRALGLRRPNKRPRPVPLLHPSEHRIRLESRRQAPTREASQGGGRILVCGQFRVVDEVV
jgi:hypothetical protein